MPRNPAPASELVEALLSRPPHALLRSGTGLMAGGLILLLAFAAFIRYPDVVHGEARITSLHPPLPIQGAHGEIEILQVGEGDTVQTDQILAVLSQDLPLALVSALKAWVQVAVEAMATGDLPAQPPRLLEPLGELQAPHAVLLAAWDALQLQQAYNLSAQDCAAAQQRLQLLGQRTDRLRNQDSLLAQKLHIATDLYRADSMLWSKGSASWLEVQQARERLLSAQDAYAQAQAGVLDRELLTATTLQDIQRLGLEQNRSETDLESNYGRSLLALGAAIDQWEAQHLLRAPFGGILTFDTPPEVGQQWVAGQIFAWLIPLHTGPRFAKVRIPAAGAGKVEKGQQVQIALADFPRAEFGTLDGQVAHVAPLLIDGQYTVDVTLPANLQTNLGTQLPLRTEAIGQAEIITRERSLLARVCGQVMDAVR